MIISLLEIVESALRLIQSVLHLSSCFLGLLDHCSRFGELLFRFAKQRLDLRAGLQRSKRRSEIPLLQIGGDTLGRVEPLLKLRQHVLRLRNHRGRLWELILGRFQDALKFR